MPCCRRKRRTILLPPYAHSTAPCFPATTLFRCFSCRASGWPTGPTCACPVSHLWPASMSTPGGRNGRTSPRWCHAAGIGRTWHLPNEQGETLRHREEASTMAMTPGTARAHLRLLLAALFALLALAAQPAAAQERAVDIDSFYEQLEPYGQWFEHPVWGTVWRPRVDGDWRPYAHGRWVYTNEFGWYWEAEEPWGWGPFHYGRWLIDEDGAWIWIPDTEWGPAWVAWRSSDDYVGWAPLPPDAYWGAGGELVFNTGFYSAPRYHSVWCFVRPHQLILPSLHRYLVPRRQVYVVFRSSRPFRAHHKFDGHFVNAGFDVRRFERMTGRP